MRWLMKLFGRQSPPDRQSPSVTPRDPAAVAAQQAYQEDKMAAAQKLIAATEMLARLRRMGYELDGVTRRDDRASHG
jgi:hypothetical protein